MAAKTKEKPVEVTASPFEAIHLKYRPLTLADVVGQTTVIDPLKNSLQNNRVVPAYLFCGTRGTGKTSTARAFARSLNCLNSDGPTPTPCLTCDSCQGIAGGRDLDVMEIDAASNNGVDDARLLIERVGFSPVRSRWKVIIIDECHMLTPQASNALLKTVEEPPPRVVFILATTDPQKVLPTIHSRCQVHHFKRLSHADIATHLSVICAAEAIEVVDDALMAIAAKSEGSLRNAQTLLGKLAESQPITVEKVQLEDGGIPEAYLMSCMKGIYRQDIPNLVLSIHKLMEAGFEPTSILETLIRLYRDILVLTMDPEVPADRLYSQPNHHKALLAIANKWGRSPVLMGLDELVKAELMIGKTAYPRLWVEVTLIRLGGLNGDLSTPR